jgi:hypothetical protein
MHLFVFLKSPNFWICLVGVLSGALVAWSVTGFVDEKDFKQAAFDFGMAIFVSLLIYVLISWWPEKRKKIALQRYLKSQYEELLNDLIPEYLYGCGELCELDTVNRLKNPNYFKEYFKERFSESQDRWNVVASCLQSDTDRCIRVMLILKRFQAELDVCVTLSAVNIEQGGFAQLRHMSHALKRTINQSMEQDYEGIKQLCCFLWSLHTGWSFADGYVGENHFEETVRNVF